MIGCVSSAKHPFSKQRSPLLILTMPIKVLIILLPFPWLEVIRELRWENSAFIMSIRQPLYGALTWKPR